MLQRAIAVQPRARYADAMELAFELENGLATGAPRTQTRRSLYERNPLRFWQLTTITLLLILLSVLAQQRLSALPVCAKATVSEARPLNE